MSMYTHVDVYKYLNIYVSSFSYTEKVGPKGIPINIKRNTHSYTQEHTYLLTYKQYWKKTHKMHMSRNIITCKQTHICNKKQAEVKVEKHSERVKNKKIFIKIQQTIKKHSHL